MEQHIINNAHSFKPQELSNIIYSYHKYENASPHILKDLIPVVMEKINKFNPRELTSLLWAYTEEGYFDQIQNQKTNDENLILPNKNLSDSEEEENEQT